MRNLKRALSLTLASVMLLGMMVVGTSALSFKDSDQITNVTAASVMEGIELFQGDGNGNFLPNATVTRAQMAAIVGKMLYGAKLDDTQFKGTSKFTDVPANHYANGYINLVASLGLMNGTSATTFTPDRTLTTAEAALLLCRALGYFQGNELTGNWAEDRLTAVSTATKLRLFKDLNLAIDAPLNRDNVAAMTFNAMTETVPVMYNKQFDIYYTDSKAWTNGVQFNWRDTLGYKNFDLVCQTVTDGDDFGRPATEWGTGTCTGTTADNRPAGVNMKVSIVKAPDDYVLTYTVEKKAKDIFSDLGKPDNIGSVVYKVDGADGAPLTLDADSTTKIGGKGSLIEVYSEATGSSQKKITVVVTNTYLVQATADYNAKDEELKIKSISSGTNLASTKISNDDVAVSGYKKDDMLLVTGARDSSSNLVVKTAALAEMVEGKITAVKGQDYVKLDGAQHDKAKNFYNIDGSSTNLPAVNDKVKLYLDKYNNVIATDTQGITVEDYLYITDAAKGLGGLNAEAVFSDGTKREIKIVKVDNKEKASLADNDAKEKVFTYTEDDGEYTLTTPANALGDKSKTDGATKKGSATVTLTSGTDVTANNKTIFVDVDGGKVYEGYANVPTYSGATMLGARKTATGPATILFITKGDVSESESFWFYVKDAGYEESKDGSTTYRSYTVYTKDGETKEFVTKNMTTTGDKATLAKDTIYKAKSMDSDGRLTAFDDAKDTPVATALANTAAGNVKSKGDGVIELDANTNDLSGASKKTFTYDGETVFIVAKGKMDAGAGTTDSVSIGSDSDINLMTAAANKSTVYILNVKDKNDDTPLATLVLVVNAADAPAAPANPATPATYVSTAFTTASSTYKSSKVSVSIGGQAYEVDKTNDDVAKQAAAWAAAWNKDDSRSTDAKKWEASAAADGKITLTCSDKSVTTDNTGLSGGTLNAGDGTTTASTVEIAKAAGPSTTPGTQDLVTVTIDTKAYDVDKSANTDADTQLAAWIVAYNKDSANQFTAAKEGANQVKLTAKVPGKTTTNTTGMTGGTWTNGTDAS